MEEETGGSREVKESPFQDRSVIALMVVILILGAFLRLYHLDSKSLWYDEIVTAVISDKDNDLATVLGYALRRIQNVELGQISLKAPARPPLYFVIAHLFLQFGSSDFLMRLPAALLGILGIAAIYLVGTILFGKREGVLSAFLLSISAFHIRYSQDARYYSLFALLSLISLYFFYRGVRSDNWKWWAGFAASTLLNLYAHHFALFILLAQGIFVGFLWIKALLFGEEPNSGDSRSVHLRLIDSLRRVPIVPFSLSALAVLSLYSPMIPQVLKYTPVAEAEGPPKIGLTLPKLVTLFSLFGAGSGIPLYIFVGTFLWGAITSLRKHREVLLLGLLWIAIPIGFFLLFPMRHSFRPRYLIFVLPLYLTLIARGITSIGCLLVQAIRSMTRFEPNLLALSLSIAIVFGAVSVAPMRAYYAEGRPSLREIAAYLGREALSTDALFIDWLWIKRILLHYNPELEMEWQLGRSKAKAEEICSEGRRAWFIGGTKDIRALASELEDSSQCSHIAETVFKGNESEERMIRWIEPVTHWPIYLLCVAP
ncbi:MAG: glycosyltransferase family 39 protein [Anaerolineae bacterium]